MPSFFTILQIQLPLVDIAISRKVVGKNAQATIPKGNMGYDQYTVPEFRAEKRSAQASAHPLSQAQGGLFCVLTVFDSLFVCH